MNTPQLLTRAQSRIVDELAINRYGIPGMVLMENAGRGVAEFLTREGAGLLSTQTSEDNGPARQAAILCGKGNNAGDGFVIARHLEILGFASKVLLLAPPNEFQGDARQNFEILTHTNVPLVDLSSTDDLLAALESEASDADCLIDAMLGTGAQGEPREPIRTAIEWMNRQSAIRVAIDVPSGLDCDTGQAAACCVRADHTCTFVTSKVGFAEPSARDFVGQLHVVSIGVPPVLIEEAAKS